MGPLSTDTIPLCECIVFFQGHLFYSVRNTGQLFCFLIRSLLDKIYVRIWVYIGLYLCKAKKRMNLYKKEEDSYSDAFPEQQSLMSSLTLVIGLNNSNGDTNSALLKLTAHKESICNKKMNLGTHQGHGWRYMVLSVYAYELWHLGKTWPSSSCSFLFL